MTTIPKFFGKRLVQKVVIPPGTTALDFINLRANKNYQIKYNNIFGSVIGANISLRVSVDNGATFVAAANYYFHNGGFYSATATAQFSSTATGIPLDGTANGMGSGVGASINGVADIIDPMNPNTWTRVNFISGGNNGTHLFSHVGQGNRSVTEANNAIRIYVDAGSFLGGTVELWEEDVR